MTAVDPELLKWFASLGVGGILAGVIFVFYRRDTREHAQQLTDLNRLSRDDRTAFILILEKNAEANMRVAAAIDANTDAMKDMKTLVLRKM